MELILVNQRHATVRVPSEDSDKHGNLRMGIRAMSLRDLAFRRTWTDAEDLLKDNSFFILSFVFLSEFAIRQVQTNIY